MSSVGEDPRGRLNLRVDPRLKARLRAAAEANGETVTGFVLAAAAERAEEVLERAERIAIGAEAFVRFAAALDAADESMPTLSRYAKEPSPIPTK
jgi:uncharacterized protein (DUF1778 family)